MMRRRLQIVVLAVLFALLPSPAGPVAKEQQTPKPPAQTIAIVSGAGFPKDRLTLKELRAIYLGEVVILKDLWIHPIDQQETQPIRRKFLEQVVRMTRDRYIDYWNQRLFRYGGFTPLLKNNGRDVIETVREEDGTLGYVWLEEARSEPKIKVLLTLDNP